MSLNSLPTLLLHVCCAPCSGYLVGELGKDYDLSIYFYNPNIHPLKEYERRLSEVRLFASSSGAELIEGDYDIRGWFGKIKGYEEEKERGTRCNLCFDFRLSRTSLIANERGFDYFGTVLSISPHKDAAVINRIGLGYSDSSKSQFIEANWKKKERFKLSMQLSKDLGFYRQSYCGCVYSIPNS